MKNYPYNRLPWKSIDTVGYPTTEEFGPYPTVLVSVLGRREDGVEVGRFTKKAELRFFGRDKTRPYWREAKKDGAPLENDVWHVTHWTPLIADPE